MSLLHVSAETLEKHGAVSRETVTEMVKGAMKTLKTDCAVATSVLQVLEVGLGKTGGYGVDSCL